MFAPRDRANSRTKEASMCAEIGLVTQEEKITMQA